MKDLGINVIKSVKEIILTTIRILIKVVGTFL